MVVKIRPAAFIMLLLLCAVLISGCETTKGVAVGIGATAAGAAKDTQDLWQAIVKADNWIRKNAW